MADTSMVSKREEKTGSDPATLVLHSRLSHHPVHRLALGQILVGLLAVASQLVISLCNDVHLHLNTLGEGLWAGLVFFTVGCLGVLTSNRTNQFTVRSFMVLNICAFIFSILLLFLSSCLLVDIIWYQEVDDYAQSGFYILKTFLSLEIVVALVEIILSVTCGFVYYKSSCFTVSGEVASDSYPLTSVRIFSILQIVIGVSSIVLFLLLLSLSLDSRHSLTFEELYCGLVFLCVGVFGLFTLKHVTITSLTPFLILNFFACIFACLLLALASARIFMLDRLQENIVTIRQQDLQLLPRLNCTKDVLESVGAMRRPNIFGVVGSGPSSEEIRHNIQQCELMKLENMREAKEVVSGESDYLGWPRKVFILEIGLSLLELLTAVTCMLLCCRVCCCARPHRAGHQPLTEEEKWQLVVQEYNEYRK